MPFNTYPYELPPLPYAYDALEPYIDTETMHIHHNKHFAAYITNLNNVLKDQPCLQKLSLEQLLCSHLPAHIKTTILNNAGGVYNHTKFFENLSPVNENNHMPSNRMMWMIQYNYGSWENFKRIFTDTALSVFGSGWACLSYNRQRELKIISLANQDTVVPYCASSVILCDVWEHAYYLKYRNMRSEYVNNIWNILKFQEIE